MAVEKFGGPLYRKLADYGASDFYAFHMPGHKRLIGEFENPFHMDITEIDGFDDLHHPEAEGILTEAQRRAARVFGAEETHFLINGSTAGILSAISGCTKQGGTLLMARNCHRSAYHGAELRGLKTEYLYPQYLEELGINGAVLPEDVEKALNEKKEIQAVMIVSPTYDGVCSDVERIAAVCHSFGVPLIVDQAHGAHFRFSEYFPEDAVSAGADVVIHSVHKTLPSLTQTALLHVQGKLVDRERIRKFLSVYQSSSPSYVLMASIDACVDLIEREGRELFEQHVRKLRMFRENCRDLKMLYLAGADRGSDFDRSKLLISARRANRIGVGLTGEELSRILRERYHIQMEMSGPDYVVGIASVGDSQEGFRRLAEALHEMDRELDRTELTEGTDRKARNESAKSSALPRLEAVLTISEAGEAEGTCRPLAACEGAVSGTYVYLYPPGIPVLAPGERVTAELLKCVEAWLTAGYEVHGLEADSEGNPALKIVINHN
ncbi:aminotransferase class I/II-fold pyridoxal phosphate-dependent enzyme [Candidatus Merdisoma sp. HCP28S3_D10]|uniref:aminotransferase class I/II-fold pyridoxal phosphate-dependent enzyme n=1 Tax=unclassified Candidatus Merdisoma TaxID=3099611 RepID=UPI003F89DBE2